MPVDMHEDQLQVTAGIVAELVSEQFPEWSRLPITRVQPEGTVNAIFRIGPGPRRRLRRELGCDNVEWERGKAWALQEAMGAAWYYRRSNPGMHTMGFRTLERILADEP